MRKEADMVICPICKKKIRNGYICTECGHDESRNIENYLSIVKISGTIKTISEEAEAYQNKMAEARLCALMGERMNRYEAQMKLMATQISEQQTQISEQKTQILDQKKRLEELEKSKNSAGSGNMEKTADSIGLNGAERSRKTTELQTAANPNKTTNPLKTAQKESWKVGEIVKFGEYTIHQKNRRNPIEWIVVNRQRNKCLLLSRYGLDFKRYSEQSWNIKWENSGVRTWLNEEFYWNAFSAQEKEKIFAVKIGNNPYSMGSFVNPGFYEHHGVDNKVFLLSKEEVDSYLKEESQRKAELTPYAKTLSEMGNFNKYGRWWLRNMGSRPTAAMLVNVNGYINDSGLDAWTDDVMVRPAMWVINEA